MDDNKAGWVAPERRVGGGRFLQPSTPFQGQRGAGFDSSVLESVSIRTFVRNPSRLVPEGGRMKTRIILGGILAAVLIVASVLVATAGGTETCFASGEKTDGMNKIC